MTERIRLTSSIAIAPYRANGALVAKQAATIDHLSNGRLVLGVAVGGREDDYEASGVDFRTRGRRFEDMLQQWQRVWAGESFGFAGAIGPSPPNGRPAIGVHTSQSASGTGMCAYWIGRPWRARPVHTFVADPSKRSAISRG